MVDDLDDLDEELDETEEDSEPEEPSESDVQEIVALLAALKATKKSTKQERVTTNTRRVRAQADRVLDRTQLKPAITTYDQATTQLSRNISRQFRGRTREKLSAVSATQTLQSVNHGLQQFGTAFGQHLKQTTRDVVEEGYQAAAGFLTFMLRGASPLDDYTTAQRIVQAQALKIAPLRAVSAQSIAQDIADVLREKLQLLTLDAEATVSDMINEVDELLDEETWRIERVVRTETNYAYNAAQAAALAALGGEPQFKGLMSRWTELVDDLTRAPLDRRVGKDSIVLHGQVARPGGVFTMPPGADVPRHLAGRSWSHPPNRPNDRAILIPWMPDWGVPAWMYRSGSSISL